MNTTSVATHTYHIDSFFKMSNDCFTDIFNGIIRVISFYQVILENISLD